jgi:hypothetical protein
MFTLLSKLAEIIASFGQKLMDSRRDAKDVQVARQLVRIAVILQDVIADGERLLSLGGILAEGDAGTRREAEFTELLKRQVGTLTGLQGTLNHSRELLATLDPRLFLELVPFTDAKSGLLARWAMQATRSQFSTTTLFFLPPAELQRVLEAGHALASPEGMRLDRIAYLDTVADALRTVRAGEVRDIRAPGGGIKEDEIDGARNELARAHKLCQQLVAATEQAVGAAAMSGLRRQILSELQQTTNSGRD